MKRKLRIAVSALTVASMIASSFSSVSFADEVESAVEVSEDAAAEEAEAEEAEAASEEDAVEAAASEEEVSAEDAEAVSEDTEAVSEEEAEAVEEDAVSEDTEAVSEEAAEEAEVSVSSDEEAVEEASESVTEESTETTTETADSSVSLFADEATDFTVVFKDIVDSTQELNAGWVAGTHETVWLNPGSETDSNWAGKPYTFEVEGVKYTYYRTNAGRNANLANKTAVKVSSLSELDSMYGNFLKFRAPAKGVAVFYVTAAAAGKTYLVYDFDESGAYVTRTAYTSENKMTQQAVTVEAGHSYVVSTTSDTNDFYFGGVKYLVDAPTDVTVTVEGDLGSDTISLIDKDTKLAQAVVNGNGTYTLIKNHTYNLVSSTIDKKATVDGANSFSVSGGDNITLKVEGTTAVPVSGEFTSNNPDFDASIIETLTFTNSEYSNVYTFTAEEAKVADGKYSVALKPGTYTTSVTVSGAREYTTQDHVVVAEGDTEVKNEIYLETALGSTTYILPAEFVNESSVLTFNNNSTKFKKNNDTSVAASTNDSIVVPVKGFQKVTVAGWYSGTWDINGENSVSTDSTHGAGSPTTNSYLTNGTETSVTINITDTAKTTYLYWVKVEDVAVFRPVINVPEDYATLTEAVNAVASMGADRPAGEAGRVTINLNKDVEEQVHITADYITINGKGHTIQWYYGQIGSYYSVDSNGYYSEALFRDKYKKNPGSGALWGGVVIVDGDYFKAVDTTFKNTFNYEVTDKEIADGAEDNVLKRRDKSSPVQAYKDKERANALLTRGNHGELNNCKILSSQDTLGMNGLNANAYWYFKNCVIGGNVDYICGGGTMVFDNCELQWKTYHGDDESVGKNNGIGYISAPKSVPYIFKDCVVTTDGQEGEGTTVLGKLARSWGVATEKVDGKDVKRADGGSKAYFINIETNGYISENAYGEMSEHDLDPEYGALFAEYGLTSNGEPFETTTITRAVKDSKGNYITEPTNDRIGVSLTEEKDSTTITNLTNTRKIVTNYFTDYVPEYSWKLGNVMGTGILSATDAAAIFKFVKTEERLVFPSVYKGIMTEETARKLANVDGSKKIDATDAGIVLAAVQKGLSLD